MKALITNPLIKGLLVILLLAMTACTPPVKPGDDTQTIYAAEQTLIAATNSVADAHDHGVLKGADYDNAKALEKALKASLFDARAAAKAGNHNGVVTALTAFNSALTQYSVYKEKK